MPSWAFDHVLIPVATKRDADATMAAAIPYLRSSDGRATVVHVIEKAGGAPDKASVEQRELRAAELFDSVEQAAEDAGVTVETALTYGVDIAATIIDTAADLDAGAIVFTPRGGSRWVRLLTGDVAMSLVEDSDRPVIVLPDADGPQPEGSADA